ncbi:hypothetical protein [Psychroflexus sp. MES1-P1E]|uniref:hypothetical protein n=1 Tax=Psychroflexus sp. MES1-P1E TaxID=2058320 RepID=UPI0011AE5396|nr:hypothetical protein [Psychroflexus sp. MES1-P1E]
MNDQETYQAIPYYEKLCTHLEYHPGQTFENSYRQGLYGFWCNGIFGNRISDNQLTKKSVNDIRQI